MPPYDRVANTLWRRFFLLFPKLICFVNTCIQKGRSSLHPFVYRMKQNAGWRLWPATPADRRLFLYPGGHPGAARWIGVKAVAVAVAVVVGCIVVGLTTWNFVALERHLVGDQSGKAAQLRTQIAQERAAVAELDTWTTDKGKVQLVIPRGY